MSILELAEQYNDFQHDFGQSGNSPALIIEQLFASNLTKIVNKKILVATRDNLEEQLNAVRDFVGQWQIISIFNLASEDGRKCTIRYELHSEKQGNWDIMAVLGSTDGLRIDSIDEIGLRME